MNDLLYKFLWLIMIVILVLPFLVVATLRILLRQNGFRAYVGGPKTLKRICFKYQVKMNLQVLVNIESVSIKFKIPTSFKDLLNNQGHLSWVKIIVVGLQINLLLKDDFKTWGTEKIELLQIINQMRDKMTRQGLLKTNLQTVIEENDLLQSKLQQNLVANPQAQKIPTYRNFLLHVLIKLYNTQCNFFVYKIIQQGQNQPNDLDSSNIREFNSFYLMNSQFQERFLCFKLESPDTTVQISQIHEDNADIEIQMQKLFLQNPCHKHKCGLLNQVKIQLKAPTSGKLVKDLCNYEIRIQIEDGLLNLNKKFLQSFINFFVYLDTLLTVIKGIRKLVFKQHFQLPLLFSKIDAYKQYKQTGETTPLLFDNFRDTVIPKHFQLQIIQGLDIFVSDSAKQLKPFIRNAHQGIMIHGCFNKATCFEMTRTLKDSYFMQFKCDNIKIDVNNNPSIRASQFVQEIDLTFMREKINLPVKLGKMHVQQQLKFQSLKINIDSAVWKSIFQILDFYYKSRHIASVKHTILGWLSDRNFLLTNIISNSNEMRLSNEQVLEIYEQPKHQDIINTTILVSKLAINQSKNINLNANDLKVSHFIEHGTVITGFECKSILVRPDQHYPLLLASNLQHEKFLILPSSKFNTDIQNSNKLVYQKTLALKFQLCLNFEVLLDHSAEILDFAFIQRVFQRKWETKYSLVTLLQNSYKNAVNSSHQPRYPSSEVKTIVPVNVVYFKEAQLLWLMSDKRVGSLSLTEFRPLQDQKCYEDQIGKDIILQVQEQQFKHLPFFRDENGTIIIQMKAATGQLLHKYLDDSSDQLIIESADLEWHQKNSKEHQDYRFQFGKTNGNLPHDFHFGSFINECIKQVVHCGNWFKRQYKIKKTNINFQFRDFKKKPKQEQIKRTFSLVFDFAEGDLSFDENPIKHTFVAKNDIFETLIERDSTKWKPKTIYSLMKKIKATKIYSKYVTVSLKKFRIMYAKPSEFQSDSNVYERISQLDEADQFLSRDLFSELRGSIQQYSADYMAWNCRSFIKPILEVWGWNARVQLLTGVMNPKHSPTFFTEQIEQKIFNKFSIPVIFNRMTNKLYYDGTMSLNQFSCAVQGQQTFLFLNDLGSYIERLVSFVDISKSLDPNKKLLPYYDGLDKFRHKNHGKFQLKINNCDIEIWPRRRINRYSSKLQVQLFDVEYGQKNLLEKERKERTGHPALLQHLLCFRNFQIKREPIKQYESALINFPLIELQLYTNYNKGETMNHYLHQKTKNMSQYLDQLNIYTTKNLYLEIKLNLPSFGIINQTKRKSLFLPQLMQSYIANSPVPIINYQRSYLQVIDEVLKEYYNGGKRDVSGRVLKKVRARSNFISNVKTVITEFQINCNAFLCDFMCLFTDFEEADNFFGEQNLDNQILDPNEIEDDTKRDAYLARYQGLIFSITNVCFQSLTEVEKQQTENKFRSLSTSYRSNFMRLSAINSKNLFSIRASTVNQPGTMDNYRIFMNFFKVDRSNEQQDFEVLLNGFKTLFPGYVLHNELIQHAIHDARGLYDQCLEEDSDSNLLFHELDGSRQSVEDYYNFSENDTIAIISRTSYYQNKLIKWTENSGEQSKDIESQYVPIKLSEPESNTDDIIVRHYLEFDKVRLLYTSKIHELIVHHTIKGFNFKQFRKTEYAELLKRNSPKPQRDYLTEYKLNVEKTNKSKPEKAEIKEQLKKEALFALVLIDPQISCQNPLTKSQLLFALESQTTMVIHAYRVNAKAFQRNKDYLFDLIENLVAKDAVKYQLDVNVRFMDCYVAPCYIINNEQFTYWASSCIKTFEHPNDGENDLRRVMQIQDISVKISLLNDSLVDNQHPQWAVDLQIKKVSCEMDGPSMWHAFCVFQLILLSRGEKSTELVFIEEAKLRDLESLGTNTLRDMIVHELKQSQLKIGLDNIRPDLARKLTYTNQALEFTFYNYNKKFASGLIENMSGKLLFYLNRESNSDVDIDRITLQNHCDSEEFRKVLYPTITNSTDVFKKLDKKSKKQIQEEILAPRTMIKIRSRDKFVVVKEAPWKVYDQIEIFIHPTKIVLTGNFYSQLKVFFFENNLLTNIKKGQTKSYSIGKAFRAVQKSIQNKILLNKNSLKQEMPEISTPVFDFSSSQSTITPRIEGTSQSFIPDEINSSKAQMDSQQQVALQNTEFPNFFRYMRINELSMEISYCKEGTISIKDLRLRMPPYISHGTFQTFRKALEAYEHHSKKHFIKQIPNLLLRSAVSMKERAKEFKTDDNEVDEQQNEATVSEFNLAYAKKILFGDLYK